MLMYRFCNGYKLVGGAANSLSRERTRFFLCSSILNCFLSLICNWDIKIIWLRRSGVRVSGKQYISEFILL